MENRDWILAADRCSALLKGVAELRRNPLLRNEQSAALHGVVNELHEIADMLEGKKQRRSEASVGKLMQSRVRSAGLLITDIKIQLKATMR